MVIRGARSPKPYTLTVAQSTVFPVYSQFWLWLCRLWVPTWKYSEASSLRPNTSIAEP